MNADKTSVFIGVYRRSSAAIHVLAFFSKLARWRVILLRLLTVAALIRAATVRERLPEIEQIISKQSLSAEAADRGEKLGWGHRLDQDAGDQTLLGLAVEIVGPAGENDDRGAASQFADAADERRPFLGVGVAERVGKTQIDDHGVRGGILRAAGGLRCGERNLHLIARDFEELLVEIALTAPQ